MSLFDWITRYGFFPYHKTRFLEGGCGIGDFFSKWIEHADVREATAVDLSPAMIEKAKNLNKKGSFIVGDLHNLPFPEGSFDLCFSLCVFHHLQDPRKALAELKRVSKGGTVVIGWNEADLSVGLEKLHYQSLKTSCFSSPYTDESSMRNLYDNLKQVLFEGGPHSIHQYINELRFPSAKDALEYYCSAMILRGVSHTEPLPSSLLAEIRSTVQQLLEIQQEEHFRKSVLHLYVYSS